MLVAFRPDAVYQTVGLKDVFLTEQFVGFLMFAVSAEEFSGDGASTFFLRTASCRIHLQDQAVLVGGLIFCLCGTRCNEYEGW